MNRSANYYRIRSIVRGVVFMTAVALVSVAAWFVIICAWAVAS